MARIRSLGHLSRSRRKKLWKELIPFLNQPRTAFDVENRFVISESSAKQFLRNLMKNPRIACSFDPKEGTYLVKP
ncbi:hypothetical protein EPO17_02780 [Patescibacteria group bacterium]|nr:MAG: hypothetical protein EPO17_02780 [Patescibacteria group bacterium]